MKQGDMAIVTEDWSYTSPVFGDTHSGQKGQIFTVFMLVDAKHSDSGFAFYRGTEVVDGKLRDVLCPAEYCELLSSEEGGE